MFHGLLFESATAHSLNWPAHSLRVGLRHEVLMGVVEWEAKMVRGPVFAQGMTVESDGLLVQPRRRRALRHPS